MSDQYYFRINGMRSDACAEKIEKVVKNITGVEYVEADLDTGMVVVKGTVNSEQITIVIDEAGYNAILIAD